MLTIFGWVGLVILVVSFASLAMKKQRQFTILDIIATVLLLIHAIMLVDYPFIISQAFIIIFLIITLVRDIYE